MYEGDQEIVRCPACGGRNDADYCQLGSFGNADVFRCRYCGWTFYCSKDEDYYETDTQDT